MEVTKNLGPSFLITVHYCLIKRSDAVERSGVEPAIVCIGNLENQRREF